MSATETRPRFLLAVLALAVASLMPAAAGKAAREEGAAKEKAKKSEEGSCTCPGKVIAMPGARAYAVSIGEEGAYLGVMLEDLEGEEVEGREVEGARITQVIPDTPADEAGLEAGDVIVRFEGEPITGTLGLTKQIRSRESGDHVSLTVERDGKEKKIEVELGERSKLAGMPYFVPSADAPEWKEWREDMAEWKEDVAEEWGAEGDKWRSFARAFSRDSRPKLGVQLVETTSELRRHLGGDEDAGVLVGKVIEGTPAERGGIHVGDLIVAVDGTPVENAGELIEELEDKDGRTFPIDVVRDGKKVTVQVTIPEPEDEEDAEGPRAGKLPLAPRLRMTPPLPPPAPVAAWDLPDMPAPPSPPAALAPPAAPAPPAPPLARTSV